PRRAADHGGLRAAARGHRPAQGPRPRRAAGAPRGQPRAAREGPPRRGQPHRSGRGLARLRGRHAGPGLPRAGVRARRAGRGRRRRPLRRHPVAARRPAPGLPGARDGAGQGAAAPGRGRRGVRRARGPVHARPRLPARPAHRQAGEDELLARGVVLRARAPPPGVAALRVRGRARRTLVYAKADLLFDGGAYASSTPAVVGNGGTLGLGPYRIPNVRVDARGVYTNNPPCGAMRGFGCVQAAFAHGALMDELADAVGVDRVEIRARNGMREGDVNITGQLIDSAAPVAELIRKVRDLPLPPEPGPERDLRDLPGGVSNTTHGEGVVRGVGYAVTYKNVGFSEGFDDYSTARVRLQVTGGEPVATVQTAAAEVGQGLVTVEQQIVRTELGVDRVVVAPKDTSVGSGGSTSASRQTYATGGAVKAACEAVR